MLRMRIFHKVSFLLSLITVCAGLAHAQTTATLTGTIKDPQGAVLPGASIAVPSVATGADRVVTSAAAADFVAPSLQPGEYTGLFKILRVAPHQLTTLLPHLHHTPAL